MPKKKEARGYYVFRRRSQISKKFVHDQVFESINMRVSRVVILFSYKSINEVILLLLELPF
jgi:predicted RNA-binding protein YlxR (DUF448 family)